MQVRAGLLSALDALPRGALFGLVTFSDHIGLWDVRGGWRGVGGLRVGGEGARAPRAMDAASLCAYLGARWQAHPSRPGAAPPPAHPPPQNRAPPCPPPGRTPHVRCLPVLEGLLPLVPLEEVLPLGSLLVPVGEFRDRLAQVWGWVGRDGRAEAGRGEAGS
jgi:hypothetical protein